ncbi:anion permease [Sulfurospirillum multivorans]|uniref:2-oxoglutarate/malate antiporter n=2 Tax=Sulfurospirillum multivorans TaxID=66821 RepID=A0AA86AQ52_SULMK|nr:anion permease [Sulfurospirillum multivorans]AHJ13832.1 2-oxoglutarate/malate antiporter [Sulfurospirillum multivorans DSM 12446]QEH07322.1 2-oxoglutarate/malate antiporter [Sulfurospirillum multivorans]
MNKNIINGLLVLFVGALLWFIPAPDGITAQGWHLFAIFVATILGFILQPLPMGALAFISITLTILFNVLKPSEALSGFGNNTIWLIASAFIFAKGFIVTGFGRRIAYIVIKMIGDSTLKLGYAVVISDLIMSPAMPSSGARAGGVLYPIVRSLATALKSEPNDGTNRKAGSFLMQILYQGNTITNAMFLTSMAANPLIATLAQKALGIEISWGLWALGACVPGIVSLIIIPYFLYKVYPPEVKEFPEGKEIAKAELAKMGPLSFGEKIICGVFVGALALWSTSQLTGINATVVAMLGVSVMVITKTLDWKDVLEEKGAWDTLIWMGTLMTLAGFLTKFGLIGLFSKAVSAQVTGISWPLAMTILIIVYVYSHYAFASLTAHITAMYIAFCTVMVAAGAPAYLVALSMAYMSNICMSITHYGGAPAPIIFGAGYVDQATWWKLGFYTSIINLIVWVGIGGVWWKVIGLW